MKPKKTTLLAGQLRRFKYAFEGVIEAFTVETSVRIHFAIALVATILGFVFEISRGEWFVQLIFISLVISLEMLNSVVELLVDEQFKTIHPVAKSMKDISAGAVLVASIGAFIAGWMIYWPKVNQLLGLFSETPQ